MPISLDYRSPESISRRRREATEWNVGNERSDPAIFTNEILPLLHGIPLGVLAAATGLSIHHCGYIRRGLRGDMRLTADTATIARWATRLTKCLPASLPLIRCALTRPE